MHFSWLIDLDWRGNRSCGGSQREDQGTRPTSDRNAGKEPPWPFREFIKNFQQLRTVIWQKQWLANRVWLILCVWNLIMLLIMAAGFLTMLIGGGRWEQWSLSLILPDTSEYHQCLPRTGAILRWCSILVRYTYQFYCLSVCLSVSLSLSFPLSLPPSLPPSPSLSLSQCKAAFIHSWGYELCWISLPHLSGVWLSTAPQAPWLLDAGK